MIERRFAHGAQAVVDALQNLHPPLPAALLYQVQAGAEFLMGCIETVTQEVNVVVLLVLHAELNPGQDSDAMRLPGCKGFGERGDTIVVGNGQTGHPMIHRFGNQLPGCIHAVRIPGVGMQIDAKT